MAEEQWQSPIFPLRLESSSDVTVGSDEEAVVSSIGQVLGTRCSAPGTLGEMPWRPSFGCKMEYTRHKDMHDTVAEDVCRNHVIEAITKWEPRAALTEVDVAVLRETETRLRQYRVTVKFRIVSGQQKNSNQITMRFVS